MSDIINSIKKDTVIIACKKRAKEIIKKSPELTLMQCMDLSAKELKFNNWHDLHSSIKNKLLNKNYSNIMKIWDNQINDYFNKDYEAIHFEVRGYEAKVKGRKFGILEEINSDLDIVILNKVLKELKISPSEYGWLEKEKFNLQTMPVFFQPPRKSKEVAQNDLTMNDYYDIVIVKKQNKIKSNNETDFNERLKGIGFSLLNISDIKHNFTDKNYVIAGATGSGTVKTAQEIVKELINKEKKVYVTNEINEINIKECIESNFDYMYFPELRVNNGNLLNSLLMSGIKVVTTIHAQGIDLIKNRLENIQVNTDLLKDSTLLLYQKTNAILCEDCKEEESSFEKVLKEEMFLDYLRKYKKSYEGKLFKKSEKMNCVNPKCHHGLIGRILIAETFNLEKTLPNYNNDLKIKKLNAFNEEKISELLRIKSADYYSNKFKKVLDGIIEL